MALFVAGKLFNKAGSGGGGSDPHNLGYYADLTALQTAHPTGQDGDFAILGSTDTVWIWDSGTTAWVDSDQKGQVTSVNNKTGAVTIGAADVLPSQTGNNGKFLTTDGTDASWGNTVADELIIQHKSSEQGGASLRLKPNGPYTCGWTIYDSQDKSVVNFRNDSNGAQLVIGDYYSGSYMYVFYSKPTQNTDGYVGVVTSAPHNRVNLGRSDKKWNITYTTKINNGSDITIPNVAGEMAVKQVNTTVTLAAASWSSNTQTVNVTGMTATGVVFPCPVPADQADYTDAGIICSAQAAGSLEFTCDTTPTNDIDVQIVML